MTLLDVLIFSSAALWPLFWWDQRRNKHRREELRERFEHEVGRHASPGPRPHVLPPARPLQGRAARASHLYVVPRAMCNPWEPWDEQQVLWTLIDLAAEGRLDVGVLQRALEVLKPGVYVLKTDELEELLEHSDRVVRERIAACRKELA